jgi:hypothetical protein
MSVPILLRRGVVQRGSEAVEFALATLAASALFAAFFGIVRAALRQSSFETECRAALRDLTVETAPALSDDELARSIEARLSSRFGSPASARVNSHVLATPPGVNPLRRHQSAEVIELSADQTLPWKINTLFPSAAFSCHA